MLNENMGYDISKFVYLFFGSGFYTASLSGETIGCFRRGSAYNGCLSAAACCYFIQGVSRLYIGVECRRCRGEGVGIFTGKPSRGRYFGEAGRIALCDRTYFI